MIRFIPAFVFAILAVFHAYKLFPAAALPLLDAGLHFVSAIVLGMAAAKSALQAADIADMIGLTGEFDSSTTPQPGASVNKKNDFTYELGDKVRLTASGERGAIIGRADDLDHANSYRVRYVDAHECQREEWFSPSALRLDCRALSAGELFAPRAAVHTHTLAEHHPAI